MKTKKQEFIHALAVFLTKDLAKRSIGLEMIQKGLTTSPFASEVENWRELWEASKLFGYPTVVEAEQRLTNLLK